MATPQGYDKKRFLNCQTDDFDCILCTEVAKLPKQCEHCKKCFCSQCIDDWFKRQAQCPLRCDQKFKIGQFHDKTLEKVYNNLNLKCQTCDEVLNIKKIEQHEVECSLPKCQNFENCRTRIQGNSTSPSLIKMQLCSPECQFFLNILSLSSNQKNLYKEISNFISKNYPTIDRNDAPKQIANTVYQAPQVNLNNHQFTLTWDPNAVGLQIQIKNETTVQLKEQSYIFRSALTKQGFSSGIHYWEIEPDDKAENEMKIGIACKNNFDFNTAFSDHPFGYAYYGIGQLRSGNNAQGQNYGQKFKQQGVLGVHLNMNIGTLSFALNGSYFGVAFQDSKLKSGTIYPAVAMLHNAGCKITYKANIPPYFPK